MRFLPPSLCLYGEPVFAPSYKSPGQRAYSLSGLESDSKLSQKVEHTYTPRLILGEGSTQMRALTVVKARMGLDLPEGVTLEAAEKAVQEGWVKFGGLKAKDLARVEGITKAAASEKLVTACAEAASKEGSFTQTRLAGEGITFPKREKKVAAAAEEARVVDSSTGAVFTNTRGVDQKLLFETLVPVFGEAEARKMVLGF